MNRGSALFMSWNPMCANDYHRMTDISTHCKHYDYIGLQGTKVKEGKDLKCGHTYHNLEHHLAIHVGYGAGKHTNK